MADLNILPKIAAIHDLQSALVEPTLKELGVTQATFQLLAAVGSKGGVSQADVARRLGISPATLSEAVQSAVKSGLIEQVTSATDRRVKVLTLTPGANEKLSKVKLDFSGIEKKLVKKMSESELKKLSKTLDKMVERLDAMLSETES